MSDNPGKIIGKYYLSKNAIVIALRFHYALIDPLNSFIQSVPSAHVHLKAYLIRVNLILRSNGHMAHILDTYTRF